LLASASIGSPGSIISKIDDEHKSEKAERILEMLVTILCSSHEKYRAFASTLPLTRVCLLLLGDHPTPTVAEQVLKVIALSINISVSFIRKFELVSGWAYLKSVLPSAWNANVQTASFQVLLGTARDADESAASKEISCPNIFGAILASLDRELGHSVTQSAGNSLLGGSGISLFLNAFATFLTSD
jgi:hypothetical protein